MKLPGLQLRRACGHVEEKAFSALLRNLIMNHLACLCFCGLIGPPASGFGKQTEDSDHNMNQERFPDVLENFGRSGQRQIHCYSHCITTKVVSPTS